MTSICPEDRGVSFHSGWRACKTYRTRTPLPEAHTKSLKIKGDLPPVIEAKGGMEKIVGQ